MRKNQKSVYQKLKPILNILILLLLTNSIYEAYGYSNPIDSIPCNPLFDSISNIEYYYLVDSMPEYPGGLSEMTSFFMKNFYYPPGSDACCKIIVEFIINTEGKMTNIKVLRGLQEDFDNETIRVLKLMPDWKPGKCNGQPINVKMTFPLSIALSK